MNPHCTHACKGDPSYLGKGEEKKKKKKYDLPPVYLQQLNSRDESAQLSVISIGGHLSVSRKTVGAAALLGGLGKK